MRGRNHEDKEQFIQKIEFWEIAQERFRTLKMSPAPTQTMSSGEPPKPNRFLQFVQIPNGRVNFLPDRRNSARLALRLVSNDRPRCPGPLNVPNQTGKVFIQYRDRFSSSDLSFRCRPRPSPLNSEAAFATSVLIRSLSSRRNGFAVRCKSTRQSITERKFEKPTKELRNFAL
jgi:hypothetical protein